MKRDLLIIVFSVFLINILHIRAQSSPILWINNSYNINIDTNANKGKDRNFYIIQNDYRRANNYVEYTFKNKGNDAVYIDTLLSRAIDNPYLTNPKTVSTIDLKVKPTFFNNDYFSNDTTTVISLPFHYKGKIYNENIYCNISFGKSKLIEYSDLFIDATENVGQLVKADSIKKKHCPVQLKYYVRVKNISKNPIMCTQELVVWNDSPCCFNNIRNLYKKILPGDSYDVLLELNMFEKTMFASKGKIVVYSKNTREGFICEVKSRYKR